MFIVVEGIDGAGKTTVINKLVEQLVIDIPPEKIIVMEEPSTWVRNVLKARTHQNTPISEALLFIADRVNHLQEIVASRDTHVIVMSRFLLSTAAYQGARLDRKWAMNLVDIQVELFNKIFPYGEWIPTKTYYLDVDLQTACKRIRYRRQEYQQGNDEYFERCDYLQQVRALYKMLIVSNKIPGKIVELDALQTPEIIAKQIKNDLRNYKLFVG